MRHLLALLALLLPLSLSACADPDAAAKLAYEQCMAEHTTDWAGLRPETRSEMCSGDAQSASWAAEERQQRQVAAFAAMSAAAAASVPPPQPVYVQPVVAAPAFHTTNCNAWAPGQVSCTSY